MSISSNKQNSTSKSFKSYNPKVHYSKLPLDFSKLLRTRHTMAQKSSIARKLIKPLKINSLKDTGKSEKDFFNINTSEEKQRNFNLIPSVSSLVTDGSIYSIKRGKRNEVNLYCLDKSSPDNNSGSQGDIIYRKRNKSKKTKEFFSSQRGKTLNLKGILGKQKNQFIFYGKK